MLKCITTTPTNGPTKLIDAQTNAGFSSDWVFSNAFANKSSDSNNELRDAINGGLDSGKVFMTYPHSSETLYVDCGI